MEKKYVAIIKHNGKYYVSRKLNPNSTFGFLRYSYDAEQEFKNTNKELRREIAKQIQTETAFKNTHYDDGDSHWAVSLYSGLFFKNMRIAVFLSDHIESKSKTVDLPYCDIIKDQCSDEARTIMRKFKLKSLFFPCFMYAIYLLYFGLFCIFPDEPKINMDLTAFLFVLINYAFRLIDKGVHVLMQKSKRRFWWKLFESSFSPLAEMALFLMAFGLTLLLQSLDISALMSKLGFVFLMLDALIRLISGDQ